MAHHPRPTSNPRELEAYLDLLIDHGLRRARSFERGSVGHADDLVQRIAEQFLRDPARIMANYTAEVFVNVAIRNRHEDHRRDERVQRGQGAREDRGDDGARRPRREVASVDELTAHGGEFLGSGADIAESVCTSLDVREALALLSDDERRILLLVHYEGRTTVEVARVLGLSRSTVHRRLAQATATVREYVIAA